MEQAATCHPFVQFLADMDCETDADVTQLMDDIADILGDMLGSQSDRYAVTERFVTRLQAAAEAAAQDAVMLRN